MSKLLRRSSLRYLLRHPGQLALAVAGVALGVAVVVSIDLANASAARAFSLATESVTGRATHRVVGGSAGIDEDLFRKLVVEVGVKAAAPVIEGFVTVAEMGSDADPDGAPRVLRVLGVDPLSEAPFRPYLAGLGGGSGNAEGGFELGAFLLGHRAAVLSATTAQELGVGVGDALPVRLPASRDRLQVVALLDPADDLSRQALADLVILDVGAAQELLGKVGRLSHIDLRVEQGVDQEVALGAAGEALLQRVRSALPPGARLEATGSRQSTSQQMTRAFRLNLHALSLLALVCGLFLIYNAITFSVVQRRTLLGSLRALGVTRRQVFALILAEAGLVAVAGTLAGLALGVFLGRGMVDLVSRTLNDLYFVVSVRDLALSPVSLAKGALLGIGATLAAAAIPAREAATAPPRAALTRSVVETDLRRALPGLSAAALGLVLFGGLLLALPSRNLLPAFAGIFAVIVGFALLAPSFTLGLMKGVQPVASGLFGVLGRLAARGVVASLSRTSVAIAALAVAVSVTVGVGVMVDSFRGTVDRWLTSALSADIYVSPAGSGASGAAAFDTAPLPAALEGRLAAVPGVADAFTVRRILADTLGSEGQPDEPTRLVAIEMLRAEFDRLDVRSGHRRDAWRSFSTGHGLIVSEPYAYHRALKVGDAVTLATPRGGRPFTVAAIYASYASDRGVALLDRATYRELWGDTSLSGISVKLAPEVTADAVLPALRQAAGPDLELVFQSSRALREASLQVFDRTFRITGVLRLLAGLVAFIGVVSALMALELERARELGVMRANGLTPGQVWRLVTAQTGLMGLAAGLLSLPVGLVLAALMIHVINRRSFGWSLEMTVDPWILAEALALALVAALLAGLYPAWRMSRTSPALALREE